MSTHVEIYGMKYSIKGSSDPERIQQVAAWVDQRMQNIRKMDPRLDVTRIAVLAAINLADELMRLQEEYSQLLRLLDEESKGIGEA